MMRRLAWLLPTALIGSLVCTSLALAQASAEEIDIEDLHKQRAARLLGQPPIDNRIARYMLAATKAMDDDPERARTLLEKLNLRRLSSHERAQIFRLLAYVAYGSGDYEGAIEYFEKVLGEEILRVTDDDKIRFSIGQLHAALEHWEELIAALQRWLLYVRQPNPLGYYLIAIAHYQLEQYEDVFGNS